jgi:hypothetical protein
MLMMFSPSDDASKQIRMAKTSDTGRRDKQQRIIRRVSTGTLGWHAAFALMKGCEARPTLYRIGRKS